MRIVALTLLAFAISGVAVFADEPPKITVVKTWNDLQAVRPIEIGDGVKVRLGLGAEKTPQWSGTLLFCLTEGYVPANSGKGPTLGPVLATCEFGDERTRTSSEKWGRKKKEWPPGSYLYARAVGINRVGTYHITVADRQEKVLAKACVEGTKDFFHPWIPWFYIRDVEDLARHAPTKGIALPTVDNIGPIAFVERGKEKSGDLPTLLPTDKSPKLAIKIDGDNVIIRSEKELHAKHASLYLLTRWWVNDKPFVPQQADSFWDSLRMGILEFEKELPMALSFSPGLIGAKPGDKIGLQILYCESEWSWIGPRMHGHSAKLDGANLRLSNRVDFVAPVPKEKCLPDKSPRR